MTENNHIETTDQNKTNCIQTMDVAELWKEIHRSITTFTERLEAKVESYVAGLEDIIACVEQRIEAVKDDYKVNLNKLTGVVTSIRADHHHRLQQFGRMERALDLVFSGVPYQRNEDLYQIYQSVARSIGVVERVHPMVYLKRLSNKPSSTGSPPPILCQFAFRGLRDEFFNKYLYSRSLTLRHIGFEGVGRIYVNESLTSLSRRILNAANKLRKEGRIYRVSTKNGLVSVITHEKADAVVVDNLEQWLNLKSNLS